MENGSEISPSNRSSEFTTKYLENDDSVQNIISGNVDHLQIMAESQKELNTEENNYLVYFLIQGINSESLHSQDKRDACLDTLKTIDLSEVNSSLMLKLYTDALNEDKTSSDPYGSIDGMINAAKVIFPRIKMNDFGPWEYDDLYKKLIGRLLKIPKLFKGDEKEYAERGFEEIRNLLPEPKKDLFEDLDQVEALELQGYTDTAGYFKSYLEGLGPRERKQLLRFNLEERLASLTIGVKPAILGKWKVESKITEFAPNVIDVRNGLYTKHAALKVFEIFKEDFNDFDWSKEESEEYVSGYVNACISERKGKLLQGLILGFPECAARGFPHFESGNTYGYHNFGYGFIYDRNDIHQILSFHKALRDAYNKSGLIEILKNFHGDKEEIPTTSSRPTQ